MECSKRQKLKESPGKDSNFHYHHHHHYHPPPSHLSIGQMCTLTDQVDFTQEWANANLTNSIFSPFYQLFVVSSFKKWLYAKNRVCMSVLIKVRLYKSNVGFLLPNVLILYNIDKNYITILHAGHIKERRVRPSGHFMKASASIQRIETFTRRSVQISSFFI